MSAVAKNELPEGWQLISLGTFRGGKARSINPSDQPDEIFELYSVPSYSEGTPEIISGKEIGSSKRVVVPNTVLLSKINPRINRVWIVGSASKHRQISSPEWVEFFPTESVKPKYLMYFMQNYKFREHLSMNVSGVGGSLTRIRPKVAEDYEIPLAPYIQQKRIVAKIEKLFSHIDAGIEALEKAKQLLKQYRQSVLKAAVTGELTKEWREANKAKLEPASQLLERILNERRQKWEEQQLKQFKAKGKMPKNDNWKEKYSEPRLTDVLELPNEWVTTSLDQLTEYITSGSRGWAKFYSDSGATFIRAQNLKYDGLDLDSIAYVRLPDKAEGMRTRVKYGDLLITITGANVTKTGYVDIDMDEAYVSQHVALCRPIIKNCVRYLYMYLISKDGARKKLEEAAYGAGKPGLNLNNLKTLQIALPSIEEQEEVSRLVEQRFGSIQRLEDELIIQLRKAEKNKQSILASAFAGELCDEGIMQ